jgi:hypothetical protein
VESTCSSNHPSALRHLATGQRPTLRTPPLRIHQAFGYLRSYCSPPSALPLGGRGAQDYKRLDGKVVSVEELEGKDAGVRAVKEAMDLYTAMVVRDLQS